MNSSLRSEINEFFNEFAARASQTQLENPKLFALNFIIKTSDVLADLDLSGIEWASLRLDQDALNISGTNSSEYIEKAFQNLKEALSEVYTQCSSEVVLVERPQQKELSLQEISIGLGIDQSKYDQPSGYVLGNY